MRTKGVTLLEIVVVTAMVGIVAATSAQSISGEVRRRSARYAAEHALLPHQVARDRAVASRKCVETFLIPATPGAMPTFPASMPSITQRRHAMVAIAEWSACTSPASITRVELVELEGDVSVSLYAGNADGRLVFGPDGGIAAELPTATASVPPATCTPPRAGLDLTSGSTPRGSSSGGGTCTAPPSPPPPPTDVTFTVTTFDGKAYPYHVFARVGATQ